MRNSLLLAMIASLFFGGCTANDHDGAAAQKKGEHEEIPPASFDASRGLVLAPETQLALGVTTAEVTERSVGLRRRLMLHVFEEGPPAKASVVLPETEADELASGPLTGARFIKIEPAGSASTGFAELLFELPETTRPKLGDFVAVDLARAGGGGGAGRTPVVAVPSSAVLDTATGSFVYVLKADHYRKTATRIGERDDGFAEIKEGLAAGEVVVTHPVQTLWLIELRLMTGSGDDD